jgi:hypothetical protein
MKEAKMEIKGSILLGCCQHGDIRHKSLVCKDKFSFYEKNKKTMLVHSTRKIASILSINPLA